MVNEIQLIRQDKRNERGEIIISTYWDASDKLR